MFRPFKDRLKLAFGWITLPIKAGPLAGMRWIAWCGKRFLLGTYEPKNTQAMVDTIKPGQTTYDIGGHVGYYAIIQSRIVGDTGRVICFEPRPVNISYIKRHMRINEIRNMTLVESAVSDTSGIQKFESRTGTGTGRLSDNGNLDVATKAVDVLIENEGFPAPDFIKIDVEGGEIGVINGAQQTISKHQPNLLVATHGVNELKFVLDFLAQEKYEHKILDDSAEDGHAEILAWSIRRAS